ncbi:hypothetical protein GMOD_00004089 [Pyrenophora seminiperda CCB06]|uniref:F-box domain-containing protein n=1 Tax=Pyrenophora seminiperda CCB06 TaxID=1302712 RepID=A0A3M7M0J9_9PLEO|nr:hypothetical protein GMOD_00004089 [Pyrenophora seminiperda CCB06]
MDNLPNELLLEIFSQLLLENHLNVLPISLINRRFHALANELLYSTYSLAQTDPVLFIRAIASSPNLAKCVQDINWDCRPKCKYTLVTRDAFHFSGPFSSTEARYIEKILNIHGPLGMRDLNRWFSAVGNECYLVTLLLFTPRVSTLNVAVPSVWDRHKIWFKSAMDSQLFTNLHKARITGPMHIGNLLPLFLIPTLRTLTLVRLMYDREVERGAKYEWDTNSEYFERLQRQGSWIENLYLRNCYAPVSDITRVMGSFQNLKTFEIEQGGGSTPDPSVDLKTLIQALGQQRKSLTRLSIASIHRSLDPSILEPLKVLTNVETLSLDISPETAEEEKDTCFKLSSDFPGCLPRNVKHFRLIANDLTSEGMFSAPSSALVDALIAFSRTMRGVFPDLRTLAVDKWDLLLGSFACQMQIKVLQQAFADKGVELLARPSVPIPHAGIRCFDMEDEDEDEGWVRVDSLLMDERFYKI